MKLDAALTISPTVINLGHPLRRYHLHQRADRTAVIWWSNPDQPRATEVHGGYLYADSAGTIEALLCEDEDYAPEAWIPLSKQQELAHYGVSPTPRQERRAAPARVDLSHFPVYIFRQNRTDTLGK